MAYVESVPGIECQCIVFNFPATVMCRQCGLYCAECTESQHSFVHKCGRLHLASYTYLISATMPL